MARGQKIEGEDERRGRGMSTVTKVGALVTTLGAAVALAVGVKGLIPTPAPGAVGKIENLDASTMAPISEASRKVPEARNCPGVEELPRYHVRRPAGPVAVASIELPSVVAQETPPAEPGPSSGGETPQSTTPLEYPAPDEPTTPPDTTLPDGGSESSDGQSGDIGALTSQIPEDDPQLVDDAVDASNVPEGEFRDLMANAAGTEAGNLSKRELAGIVAHTRTDGREPVGWLIDISTRLEHLSGKCAYVQWSLYDRERLRRIRYPWVVDRRGARFIARATPDDRSSTFWVPAPRAQRKYRVRVALYDAKATRLDLSKVNVPSG